MMSCTVRRSVAGAAIVTAGLAALFPMPAWAQANQPPTCSAISFRPLPSGAGDGEHETGLYKSRFGRVIVTGIVKGGQVATYYVTVNKVRPAGAEALPASVASCAETKRLPAPGKPTDVCVGDRLQVLIDRSGGKRYVLLYARQAGKWQLCSAGVT